MIRADGRWQRVDGRTAGRLVTAALAASCLLPTACCFADATHIKDDDSSLTIIRMEVTPADEAVPAFKHRLKLSHHELLPGNSAQGYLRAYPEEISAWKVWREFQSLDENDIYYQSKSPVSEVPWEKLESHKFESLRREVDIRSVAASLFDNHLLPASRLRDCDWGLGAESLEGVELIQFLLPEFQSCRNFARMGSLLIRWAVYEQRYDDAIDYSRALYRIGADCGEEQFLVCGLIGVAITNLANQAVTDLIAAPNSPNLYWALTELPSPPVSMARAMRSELDIGPRLYPFLREDESGNRTPEQWNADWKRWARYVDDGAYIAQDDEDYEYPPVTRFLPMLTGLSGYSHAKSRLIDWGRQPDEVERMSVGQALSIYSARVYRVLRDKHAKSYLTPYSQRNTRDNSVDDLDVYDYERANSVLSDGENREIIPIAMAWLPALRAARSAEVRCARDLAALRVIEALRMHAARNEGRWPRSLDEVTCVPVPLNPATDKPFLYHRDGKTAVLELPDWEGFPGFSRRYEITIAEAAD